MMAAFFNKLSFFPEVTVDCFKYSGRAIQEQLLFISDWIIPLFLKKITRINRILLLKIQRYFLPFWIFC